MINYMELVNMLPDFFKNIREYPEVMKAWAEGLRMGEVTIDRLWNNLYVQTCDEGTIEYWEGILQIIPSPGDTLDVRRNRVLNYFMMTVPYSERMLRDRLDAMYGAGSYDLIIDSVAGTADMTIKSFVSKGIMLFCDLWFRIAPAHIEMTVQEDIQTDIDGPLYVGGRVFSSRFVTIQ